jgi:Ni/Co efflux regulator RcnB
VQRSLPHALFGPNPQRCSDDEWLPPTSTNHKIGGNEKKKNKQHFTRWRKDNIYINRRTSKYEKQTMSYSSPTPVHNQKKTKTDNSFVTCEKRKKIIPQVEPLLVETERAAHLK